jgi:hypothetical protein
MIELSFTKASGIGTCDITILLIIVIWYFLLHKYRITSGYKKQLIIKSLYWYEDYHILSGSLFGDGSVP